jgi:hypothetical protein
MALRYLFPRWAAQTIGSTEPRKVRAWFLERGLDAPRQTWRKFLQEPPRSCHLATWIEICEASGEQLDAFVQIIPSGRCKPKPRFRPTKTMKRRPKPVAKAIRTAAAAPPRPSEFFRRQNDA